VGNKSTGFVYKPKVIVLMVFIDWYIPEKLT